MTTLNEEFGFNSYFLSAESNNSEYEDVLKVDENVINHHRIDTDTRFKHYFLNESTKIDSLHSFCAPVKIKIFDVVYPEKVSLFTALDNYTSTKDETSFLKRKRFQEKRRRRDNRDNIRKKIKRAFFNFALIKKLNGRLRKIGSRLNFERFPQNFVINVSKELNKELLNMSLLEIFEEKDLYEGKEDEEENDLKNYYHNLKVVKSEDVQENAALKTILNKKYCELFEEYVNSQEFVDEVKRLKEKNMEDDYIERYINLAKYFVEYFSTD